MKFGIFYEISVPRPWQEDTEHRVYQNCIEQAVRADALGFNYCWAVEHHFLEDLSRSSSNETFLAAIAQHTSRIRIGLGVCLMPMPYNHPFKIAEKVASLDIVSRGRVEWGCGRSTTAEELDGFGVGVGIATLPCLTFESGGGGATAPIKGSYFGVGVVNGISSFPTVAFGFENSETNSTPVNKAISSEAAAAR